MRTTYRLTLASLILISSLAAATAAPDLSKLPAPSTKTDLSFAL